MVDYLPSRALRAAFTASSTSALSPSAASASTSSLAGFIVSKVLPDLAGSHLPPISRCLGFLRNANTALEVTPCAALSIDGTAAAAIKPPLNLELHIDRFNLGVELQGMFT